MFLTMLFTLGVVASIAFVVVGVVKYRKRAGSDYKPLYKREVAKRIVAEQAHRRIASGSAGNPILESQLALDEIESLNMKELN